MRKPLVILGAGGFAREVLSCLPMDHYHVIAFYSEFTPGGEKIMNIPVISSLAALGGTLFIPAIGNPRSREKLFLYAERMRLRPCPPMVHPSAVVGNYTQLGPGSIVCPNAVITVNVKAGRGLLMNIGATLGHDCELGDFVTINPGANISGNVAICNNSLIGTGSCVREGTVIGQDSVIGMGSVVVKDVAIKSIVMGNPARHVRENPIL